MWTRATDPWCNLIQTLEIQKQPLEVFYNKRVLNNFTKFTGKNLCQSLFFNKVAGLRILWNFQEHVFHRTPPDDYFRKYGQNIDDNKNRFYNFSCWTENSLWNISKVYTFFFRKIIFNKSILFWHITDSLIFKLKDSKYSKVSNYICNNKYIHNRRERVNKNHFLSHATYNSVTLRKFSKWLHPLLKRVILVKKQRFQIFQQLNIRNENQVVSKNYFLSC